MSNTEISDLETPIPGAAPPPRKAWRAPKVIEAEQCRRAEKDHIFEAEGHFVTSLGYYS